MYSFSTCWNSHRHTDGRAMLQEIRDLGFEYAELSHGTRISLLPGILEAVASGVIRISTLHNFCPLPLGVNNAAPNLYQFSAERERERELAVRYTLKTLEFAEKVRAKAVVLHLGSIEMKDYTAKLIELLEKNQRESPKYEKICAEMDAKREAKKAEYFDRVKACLKEIVPHAQARGIKLGAENREALEELPLESDFHELFSEVDSPILGYWHDVGHAQIKENLGLVSHHLQLQSLQDKLVGFHIHDVRFPARDHSPPGSGTVDFEALKPFITPDHRIKVFELSPSLSVDQVKTGVRYAFEKWGVQ